MPSSRPDPIKRETDALRKRRHGKAPIESLASGHARPAAHHPATHTSGRRLRLDDDYRGFEPPARVACPPRAGRMPPRHGARAPHAGGGIGARAPRLPPVGAAGARARGGDASGGRKCGEQQRHTRSPGADLAALDPTPGPAVRRDPTHDAAHVSRGTRRRGALRRPHDSGESRGRARAAPPAPSRHAAPRRDERHRPGARGRPSQRGGPHRGRRGAGGPGRAAGRADPRPPQGSAHSVAEPCRAGAAGGRRVCRGRARRGARRRGAHRPRAPPGGVCALHRPSARLLSPRCRVGPAIAHRRAVHRPARVDGARTAGRRVGCRRQSRLDHLRRDGNARAAARPRRLGAGAGARAGRCGILRSNRAARSRARSPGVHARTHRRADRGGVPGSARAAAIARRRSHPSALSSTLLLALNFPPFGGGIARMMGEVALRYPAHSLVVSTGNWAGSAASDPSFPQTIDRVPIGTKRLRTLNGLCLWTWRAASLVRRTRPGFVWCDEIKPAGYPAAWLHARRGLAFGVIAHGADLLLLEAKIQRSPFKRWTARRIFSRCSVVVANSGWTTDLARSVLTSLGCHALAADVRTVPLGTTPSRFHAGVDAGPVRRKYGLDGGPWLLTVARLDFHKGIDTVIRALPAIRAAFPSARYAVAGVGSRRGALEALASELGLADAVRLLGFVPDDDLPSLYNAADLFVLASRRYDLLVEGFGIAIVEASASGLPVIASRSGGIPEAVREGETGFLVDPDDPAAVAAKAIRLLGDDALRSEE